MNSKTATENQEGYKFVNSQSQTDPKVQERGRVRQQPYTRAKLLGLNSDGFIGSGRQVLALGVRRLGVQVSWCCRLDGTLESHGSACLVCSGNRVLIVQKGKCQTSLLEIAV